MLYLLLISLLHSSCCFKKKCSINGGTSSYSCLACDACSHSYGHFSNAPVQSSSQPRPEDLSLILAGNKANQQTWKASYISASIIRHSLD
ncbi:hypothetical protein PVAP13_4KG006862 [Panicum virgatum]|uniref:Secreted protein n=1 Tax=Panicum virgatum TaxID=38727 RepID=A0A8T0TAX1_PANVG|nr:hypothetical protein PVAP13_4KG006862 [Panicum virgatum]